MTTLQKEGINAAPPPAAWRSSVFWRSRGDFQDSTERRWAGSRPHSTLHPAAKRIAERYDGWPQDRRTPVIALRDKTRIFRRTRMGQIGRERGFKHKERSQCGVVLQAPSIDCGSIRAAASCIGASDITCVAAARNGTRSMPSARHFRRRPCWQPTGVGGRTQRGTLFRPYQLCPRSRG
jgi:hypothetical protein